jgi:hypothetical protein
VLLTRSFDYGTYEISLNQETPVGPRDLYNALIDQTNVSVKKGLLEPGKYTLNFKVVGTNPKSKLPKTDLPGHFIGIDAVQLTELP